MKIGLTTHTYVPEFIGGREKHVESLARMLSMNHDVIVFTGSKTKKVEKTDKDGYTLYRVPLITLPLVDGESYRVVPKFLNTLMKEKLDIVHAHEYGHFTTDVATMYSKLRNVPLIMTVHGHFFRARSLNTIKKIYDKSLGLFSLKTAERIICISETQKNEVINAFGSRSIEPKIRVIPNGIMLEDFYSNDQKKRNKTPGEKLVFSLGRLVYRKGFHILIDAARILEKNTKLIIAGPDGGERRRLEDRIRRNKLEERVTLMHPVDDSEKERLFSACDIFVIPSLYEGLPTTLLEAMAYGKPVVCTDLPGLKIIKDWKNGFLVEPGSSKELAEKINLILNDEKLARKMGKNNKKMVKIYDWKRVIKRIEDVYEEVCRC